jgi:glycerophosphoryl diester phosphodiesterase
MRYSIILFLLLIITTTLTAQTLKHGAKIETKYDGFKGVTVVKLHKMKVNCGKMLSDNEDFRELCVSFEAAITYPGKQFEVPRSVKLTLILESKNWQTKFQDRNLSIALDDTQVHIGKMAIVSALIDEAKVIDTMKHVYDIDFPHNLLTQMATSKNVALRLGDFSFNLTEKNLSAIYDLLRRRL